jgi:hypothetical protein
MWYYPHTLFGKIFLERYFVMKLKWTHLNSFHLLRRKEKYDGFFDPIVDLPAISIRLSYPYLTLIHQFYYRSDGL